jgi:PEP-CTERM motif
VLFDAPFITNVALTVGTNALFSFNGTTVASFGAENLARRIDLAVTDDFVFANPQAVQAVPEPETYAMLIAGLLAVASRVIKRRRGSPPS